MKNNKGVLILIIVLMVITTSLAVWGGIANYMGVNKPPAKENVNREFHFENKLYFYNMLNLIGTYECKTQKCNYVKGTIDDKEYSIDYYDKAEEKSIPYIAKRYAFLVDGSDEVLFYDITGKNVVNTFSAVKNYGIGLDNDYYIIKDNNNKWGVMQIKDVAGKIIDYKYDFIGVQNELSEDSKLISDKFIVKDINGWKIINDKDADQSSYFINQINSFNNNFVITKNGNYYFINSLSGNLLSSVSYLYAKAMDNYVAVLDNQNQFYFINPITTAVVSQKYHVISMDEVQLENTLNGIKITIGQEEKEIVK